MHFVVVSSCFILVKKYKIMRASLYRHLWTFFLCEEEGVPPLLCFYLKLEQFLHRRIMIQRRKQRRLTKLHISF